MQGTLYYRSIFWLKATDIDSKPSAYLWKMRVSNGGWTVVRMQTLALIAEAPYFLWGLLLFVIEEPQLASPEL